MKLDFGEFQPIRLRIICVEPPFRDTRILSSKKQTMGIKAAHPYFRKQNLFQETLLTVEDIVNLHNGPILCDFFGCFYALMLDVYTKHQNQPEKVFTARVKNIFGPHVTRITMVFDGIKTQEKSETRASRQKRREQDMEKFVNLLDDFSEQLQSGQKKKLSKSNWLSLERLKRRILSLSESQVLDMKKELQSNGFDIVTARGEADVYIATIAKSTPGIRAITPDSDIFFHEHVRHTFKLVRKKSNYYLQAMHRDMVLEKLCLTNSAWCAVAVVSGNDYDSNVYGFGISSNIKIMQKLVQENDQGTINHYVSRYIYIVC